MLRIGTSKARRPTAGSIPYVALARKGLEGARPRPAARVPPLPPPLPKGVPISDKDLSSINSKLAGAAEDGKALFEGIVADAKKSQVTQESRALLRRSVLLRELTRGAGEYIRATQRVNQVRAKMKLRALLWDFAASSRAILAAWHMSETGDWSPDQKSDESLYSYSDAVPWAKENANRLPTWSYTRLKIELSDVIDEVRALAVVRENLLNPDARRLWLGYWGKGQELECIKLYAVPRGKYRDDIATPSARFRGETVAEDRDRWADVEETVQAGSCKTVVAHYPYSGEADAPTTFGYGEFSEVNWSDATLDRKGLYTMGLPIMLRFFGGEKLTDVEFELKPKGGRAVSCRKYVNGDKRVDMENLPTVLLLPEKPLDKGTTYEVRIKGKLDGTPFERKWEFTTQK
jgi:hypothetical protein